MSHPIDFIDIELPGKIAMMPCPGRKQASLQDSVADIKAANIKAVLTLNPFDELEDMGVDELPALCRHAGIDWYHLPIIDDQAPGLAFANAWNKHQVAIINSLKAGEHIAIHCKGGTGRTGTVAALILGTLGISRAQTFSKIQAIRAKALTIDKQVAYLDAMVF